jgi:FkbM family methyltransferase
MLHELYLNRHYQNDVLVALRNLLSQGDVFWDVGANHGFMSLYVSRVFNKSVETLAFEPSPAIVPFLRENVTANSASNVHVHALGLADRVGTAEFFYSEDASWNSTLVAGVAEHHHLAKTVQVPITTIDEAVQYLPPPTVLKIDVEGGESQTIAGGKRYLTEHHPAIVIEYNLVSITHAGMAPEEYLRMFRDMGYTPHFMDQPWFGWHRWDRLHPVNDARSLPDFCNLILLGSRESFHVSEMR